MIKEQYRSTVIDTTFNIVNSRIESVRNKNITRTSQRVYKDGYIGVAGAIGKVSEASLIDEAVEALDKKIEYPAEPSSHQQMACDKRQPILSGVNLVEEFSSLLDELTVRQPNFIFSNKISLSEVHADITNDAGLNLSYKDRSLSFGLIFKEKTSTSVFDGSLGFQERKYDKKLILDEFDQMLSAYSEKVDLPKEGRYPVIFFTEEAPVDKFVSDLKAELFAQGGSLFSGKLGQKLFNEAFTFGQCLDPERVYNAPFFDSEGTVNPCFVYHLIEDGVLKVPYCDKKTAAKYGYTPSGSGYAPYDGVPQAALMRHYIKRTGQDLKTLLGGRPGIMVLIAAGGDFTPQGDYATPVQLALLCDGNRFIGRLPEFNLSSNVYDMFGSGFLGVVPTSSLLPFTTGDYTVLEMNLSK